MSIVSERFSERGEQRSVVGIAPSAKDKDREFLYPLERGVPIDRLHNRRLYKGWWLQLSHDHHKLFFVRESESEKIEAFERKQQRKSTTETSKKPKKDSKKASEQKERKYKFNNFIEHVIFIAGINSFTDHQGSSQAHRAVAPLASQIITITYSRIASDQQHEEVFVFRDPLNYNTTLRALNHLSATKTERFLLNPSVVMQQQLWLLADTSGDQKVGRRELMQMLAAANIELKDTQIKQFFSEFGEDDQLDYETFNLFYHRLKTHDLVDQLWSRYTGSSEHLKMRVEQFMDFLRREQAEVIDRDAAFNIMKQLYETQPGATGFDRSLFAVYLTQSVLNQAFDPDVFPKEGPSMHQRSSRQGKPVVETRKVWDGETRYLEHPLTDYIILTSHVAQNTGKNPDSRHAIRNALSQGIHSFHFVVEDDSGRATLKGKAMDGGKEATLRQFISLEDALRVFIDSGKLVPEGEKIGPEIRTPIIVLLELKCNVAMQEKIRETLAHFSRYIYRPSPSHALTPHAARGKLLLGAYFISGGSGGEYRTPQTFTDLTTFKKFDYCEYDTIANPDTKQPPALPPRYVIHENVGIIQKAEVLRLDPQSAAQVTDRPAAEEEAPSDAGSDADDRRATRAASVHSKHEEDEQQQDEKRSAETDVYEHPFMKYNWKALTRYVPPSDRYNKFRERSHATCTCLWARGVQFVSINMNRADIDVSIALALLQRREKCGFLLKPWTIRDPEADQTHPYNNKGGKMESKVLEEEPTSRRRGSVAPGSVFPSAAASVVSKASLTKSKPDSDTKVKHAPAGDVDGEEEGDMETEAVVQEDNKSPESFNATLPKQEHCGKCTLTIKVISGQQLPRSQDTQDEGPQVLLTLFQQGKRVPAINPFVVVRIDGIGADNCTKRTKPVMTNGFSPKWDETFEFQIQHKEFAVITFQVYSKYEAQHSVLPSGAQATLSTVLNSQKQVAPENFVCQASIPVTCLRHGFRVVFLYDKQGGQFAQMPSLLCHFEEAPWGTIQDLIKDLDETLKQKRRCERDIKEERKKLQEKRKSLREANSGASSTKQSLDHKKESLAAIDDRFCYCSSCVVS
eukprot:TRINITY_DN40944_c0_g1_i1.p1 TRINITY_DN40944_c0_g1~~TRINITY_DN40944_c0_g1_i1.p1  ORF type:complete len:1090 (-),score=180.90 TRINITY_DN40944_c0_g1_i1:15-3257(-)